jgi:hypothetical protein
VLLFSLSQGGEGNEAEGMWSSILVCTAAEQAFGARAKGEGVKRMRRHLQEMLLRSGSFVLWFSFDTLLPNHTSSPCKKQKSAEKLCL